MAYMIWKYGAHDREVSGADLLYFSERLKGRNRKRSEAHVVVVLSQH